MLVTGDTFITQALAAGSKQGLESLPPVARTVFAISEAEVYCDMDGIDNLIHRYGMEAMVEFSRAFAAIGAQEIATALAALASSAEPAEKLLDHANTLITSRVGYGYEKILAYVEARI